MSFPDKEQRHICWSARDEYWDCLDKTAKNQNPKGNANACSELRKIFEKSCPSQWIKHFDRRRDYLKFKEKLEKEGYDPLDKK